MSQEQGEQSGDADADVNVNSSVIAALSASVSRIFALYRQQWNTSKQMLGAEWELTLRGLWLALVLVIVLMSVVVVTWLSINVVLAYALYSIATPLWGIALTIVMMNILMIFILTRTIRGLFKEIGFGRALAVFGRTEADNRDVSADSTPVRSGGE